MMLDVLTCEQGSDEWIRARCGIPTASEFSTVLAKGKSGAESLTRRTYLHKLAGEIITGRPAESYSNAHMDRGHEMEPEARRLYEFTFDAEVTQVGFIRCGRVGCSPDGLIGADGGLELKSKLPHLMVATILRGDLPPEHKAQVQGCLWVSNREWWDFAAYWPGFPLFRVRAYRDQAFIDELEKEVDRFNDELDAIVERVRAYGAAA
jgi:hypothetical protein